MPRMLPAHPDPDAPDSERKVFAAFERQLWTGDVWVPQQHDVVADDPAR